MQQLSNPDPMKISSLLNEQGTPMPKYSRHYPMDLSQSTQNASRLGKETRPISMLQPNGRPSKRPYVRMLGLSPTVTEQTRVDHETQSTPGLPARRKKYSAEECYFIWYQRVVLRERWDSVLKNFNNQFPNRQRLTAKRYGYPYAGIQNKFRRFIKQENLPASRGPTLFIEASSSSTDENFIKSCTNAWFSWME